MASDETSVPEAASGLADDIFLGLDRAIIARDQGLIPRPQDHHVQFLDFLADPIQTVADLYDRLDLELSASTEQAMRQFLRDHPGDGGGGGHRYRFADTDLDAHDLRERARRYQDRFGVASEAVT